jgi:hypothetical protein
MSIEAILDSHPRAPIAEPTVLEGCIDECRECTATCTVCADACLAEDDVRAMARCVRLCLDCADARAGAGGILGRQTDPDRSTRLATLQACNRACSELLAAFYAQADR